MSESEMEKNENGVADATAEGPADEAAEVPESTVCVDEPTASTEAEPDASSSDPVKAGRARFATTVVQPTETTVQPRVRSPSVATTEKMDTAAVSDASKWARQQLEERKRLREEREKLKQDSAAALPKKGLSGVTGLSLMEKQAAKFAKAEAEAESREPVNELAEVQRKMREAKQQKQQEEEEERASNSARQHLQEMEEARRVKSEAARREREAAEEAARKEKEAAEAVEPIDGGLFNLDLEMELASYLEAAKEQEQVAAAAEPTPQAAAAAELEAPADEPRPQATSSAAPPSEPAADDPPTETTEAGPTPPEQPSGAAPSEAAVPAAEAVVPAEQAELPATEAGLAPSPLAESDAGEVTEPLPPPAEVEAEQEKASVDGMSQQLDENPPERVSPVVSQASASAGSSPSSPPSAEFLSTQPSTPSGTPVASHAAGSSAKLHSTAGESPEIRSADSDEDSSTSLRASKMSSPAGMVGMLWKKGGSKRDISGKGKWMKRFNWSHRFFVLDPATSELSYYKNQGDKIPKGILLLGKDCKAFVQKHPKRDYVVAFNCPGRENFLINAERERLEEWGHALMSHLPNGITGMDEDGNFV
ncbi:hypothetical protein CYMTET_29383 [Cymbomonas tetramitiformis]|uniref:PH domain-containing protein n=1 Tax=Cymbomonas tetramitiformis TaxID=36881 RepID=A0AAE0KUZ7_9CHLO|nr:hypothetical protein CYMTET_29383 [Cymbomonas tetramitiformis]